MVRSNSAAFVDDDDGDDLDATSQVTILRRAVAELAISPQMASDKLASTNRLLTHYCGLAEAIMALLHSSPAGAQELRSACVQAAATLHEVRQLLGGRLTSRTARAASLEAARRKLYGSLSALGEQLADSDSRELAPRALSAPLERALSLRTLISDFHHALLVDAAAKGPNVRWALLVADAELSILLKHRAFSSDSLASDFARLHARIERWRTGKRDTAGAAKLYTEVVGTTKLLTELNHRPEVQKHDARALERLEALLGRSLPSLTLAGQAADLLFSLRGLDSKLDDMIVDLPLDPPGALARISRRVRVLTAKVLN